MEEGWRTVRLGELVSFKTGKLDSNAAVPNGTYPFFTCSQETLRTNTFSFDTECVLLAGNNANGIFPLKYFHGKFDAYQRTYVITTCDATLLTTKFLYYSLRPKLAEFRSFSTGAATKFLTLTILNETEITVPPRPLQLRIAGILSAYDELIENCQRRIRILEEMARAVYREWFIHFRFPGHEKVPRVDSVIGRMPQCWEVKPFSALANYINGYAFKPEHLGAEGKPIIKIKELKAGITADTPRNPGDEIPVKYNVRDGDVLFSWSADLDTYLWMSGDGLLNQHLFTVVPFDDLSLAFCFHALKESMPRFRALSLGATMHHIKRSALDQVFTILPPAALRKRFEVIVEPMHRQLITLTKHVQNLRCTRDLLLPRLLSSQVSLDVSAVEDVPEPPAPAPSLFQTDFAIEEPALRAAEAAPPYRVKRAGHGFPPSAEPADEAPVPIDQIDRTEVLQVIRQVFSEGSPRERDAAIRDVARALGYRRTGPRIQEILHTDLMTAVRRCILENQNGALRLCARAITDYDRDFLKQQFLAAIGRTWIDRDTAIRDFCRWLGFARTGPIIEDTARSLVNGLLREGRLEANRGGLIRRTYSSSLT